MGHGTKEYEDVPDGVVMALAVVCKEVGANGIQYPFRKEGEQSEVGKALHHGLSHEDNAPSHDEIQSERKTWVFAHGEQFIECSANNDEPLYCEYEPA